MKPRRPRLQNPLQPFDIWCASLIIIAFLAWAEASGNFLIPLALTITVHLLILITFYLSYWFGRLKLWVAIFSLILSLPMFLISHILSGITTFAIAAYVSCLIFIKIYVEMKNMTLEEIFLEL